LAAAHAVSRRRRRSQPKVIAHRGYWTAPESAQNSIASFTKADAIGVFGSEIDVWLTADDKLIVNHDRIYKGTDVNMEKATAKEITAIVLPNGENIPHVRTPTYELRRRPKPKPPTAYVRYLRYVTKVNVPFRFTLTLTRTGTEP